MKRLVIPVLLLVLAVVSLTMNDPAHANQQGPTVGQQATGWAVLCGLHGGTPRVTSSPIDANGYSWARTYCSGGKLGGISCYYETNPANSECYLHVRGAAFPVRSTIRGTTAVLQTITPQQPMLASAEAAWVADPMEGQGVILASINACTVLEGVPEISQLTPGEATSFVTHCEGGTLDGQWCHASAALVSCMMESEGAPLPMDTMPITDVPTNTASEPMPTASPSLETPTVVPTADTPMPTTEPTMPEVTPTMEPGLPTLEPTLPPLEPWTPTPEPITG